MTRREAQMRQAGIEKREAIRRHRPLPQEPGWQQKKKQNDFSKRLMILLLMMILMLNWQQFTGNSIMKRLPTEEIISASLKRTVLSSETARGVSLIELSGHNYAIFVPDEGQKFVGITADKKDDEIIIKAKIKKSDQQEKPRVYLLADGVRKIKLIINGNPEDFAEIYILEEDDGLPEITSETMKRVEKELGNNK